ncbi:MAG: hypothetical protein M3440_08425 [Chloroflexota bacterium]|nr:hypothetical protein [Chloroflexota bacterium]
MILSHAIEELAIHDPHLLGEMVKWLVIVNPQAAGYMTDMLAPLTPEALDADMSLSEDQKAKVYDALFEYHGDDVD